MKLTGKTQAKVDEEKRERWLEKCRLNRLEAYRNEADPIYMMWQRGEATQQEWLDKINEIKARFPKGV